MKIIIKKKTKKKVRAVCTQVLSWICTAFHEEEESVLGQVVETAIRSALSFQVPLVPICVPRYCSRSTLTLAPVAPLHTALSMQFFSDSVKYQISPLGGSRARR